MALSEAEELELLELENEEAMLSSGQAPGGDSGLRDAPNDPNFEIGMRTAPVAGAPLSPRIEGAPGPSEDFVRGLTTNEPVSSLAGGLGRAALPIAATATLPLGAGAAGLGAVARYGPAIGRAALGGAAGGAVRQTGVSLQSAFSGQGGPTTGEVLGNVGLSAAEQGLGQAGAFAIPPAAAAVGRGLVNNPVARALGGYTKEAASRLMARAEDVVSKLGNSDAIPESIRGAATSFKAALQENLELAGEKYRHLVNGALERSRASNQIVDLSDLNRAAREVDEAVNITSKEGNEVFAGFANRINEMANRGRDTISGGGALGDEVYRLQRDLNFAIRENRTNSVLSMKLGRLKDSVNDVLQKNLPEIREANKIYRAANEISDDLDRITGADDTSRAILNKMRATGSDTRQAILDAAKELPAAQRALDELLDLDAARQFSKGMPDIPRTGFGATMLFGLNQAFNPAAVATGALALPGASPLATAYVVRGAQRAASATPNILREATATTAPLLEAAYLQGRTAP